MTKPVKENFDIFLITESKIHFSVPDRHFQIPNYRVFRKEQNENGGGYYLIIANLSTSRMATAVFETNIPNNKS